MFYQKTELILELEMSSKKTQETQNIVTLQKMDIEKLLKQCSQHEHLNGTQADHILELKGRVDDLLSSIQVSSTCHFLFHCSSTYFQFILL
jgi:hypothetical protein